MRQKYALAVGTTSRQAGGIFSAHTSARFDRFDELYTYGTFVSELCEHGLDAGNCDWFENACCSGDKAIQWMQRTRRQLKPERSHQYTEVAGTSQWSCSRRNMYRACAHRAAPLSKIRSLVRDLGQVTKATRHVKWSANSRSRNTWIDFVIRVRDAYSSPSQVLVQDLQAMEGCSCSHAQLHADGGGGSPWLRSPRTPYTATFEIPPVVADTDTRNVGNVDLVADASRTR
jgi:hypothetical protein